MTRPPRFAQFLLDRVGPHNDALLGDLEEEYRRYQSTWWYWRQTIAAIVVNAADDIRHHKLLALRAITVGWLVTLVASWAIGRPLNRFFGDWVLDQLIFTAGSHPFVMVWATDLYSWPRMIAVNLVSGWVVARLHVRHGGILLAFVLVAFGRGLFHGLSIAQFRIAWTSGPVSLPATLFHVVSRALIPPVFVLIGGIWAAKAVRNPAPPKNRCARYLGDLAEECQAGRSVLWYWRQVWSVIVATAIRDSRVVLSSLLLVAVSVFAEPLIVSPPSYGMRIVDAGTGEGVHGLRITTDNGIVCYTLLDGTVGWGESSLMGRAVRFEIQDETHRFDSMGTTLQVTRGGQARVTVRRATQDHTRMSPR